MHVLKLLNFKVPILGLKTLSNGNFGVVDLHNTLRIVDTTLYTVIDGFKTNIKHERHLSSYVDLTDDGEYMVTADTEKNKAAIFSLSKRKQIYKAGTHDGEIESVAMDPNGRYFITSGQDGKSFVWVLKTSRLAFSLPPHSDFVSSVVFSHDGQWIATGSYDRTINLFNIGTMKEGTKLRGHSDVIKEIIFLPEAKLLSVDRGGGLIIWDISSGKMIKRLSKILDEVSSVAVSSDKHFLFVGTKLGYVTLYDLHTMDLISQRFIKISEAITSLTFLSNPVRLALGTQEGNIYIYSLFGDEEKYMQMLLDGEYKPFYNALEDNPILAYSKPYELAEQNWVNVIENGRKYLEQNEQIKAKELFAPFVGIPKKTVIINQMLNAYEKFGMFENYIKIGRLPLAYSLAKQYPPFQESELYRKMELQWKKVFFKAQELILSSNGEEQARELLAPYRGISEKTALTQQLFEQRKAYILMKKVLSQNDYVKFFGLVKMYPFLKEFSEYGSTMEYGDILYIQAQKAYTNGDYSTARKACKILISFPDYSKDAQKMEETIRIKHLFFQAITANDLPNAFSYLITYPLLYETPEAQLIERQWDVIVDNAQRFASTGSIQETLQVFEPYFAITDKFRAMGSVMAQAYCVQLEQKIQFKIPQKDIEYGIGQYINMFGLDEGIRSVYNYFKLLYETSLELETIEENTSMSWTPKVKIDDITVRG